MTTLIDIITSYELSQKFKRVGVEIELERLHAL